MGQTRRRERRQFRVEVKTEEGEDSSKKKGEEGTGGKKRSKRRGETVWPCVRLMYLWRKRIVDLVRTQKSALTQRHTQAQCCRDHHFVTVQAYPLSWLPLLLSLCLCLGMSGLFPAHAGLNTADSGSGGNQLVVALKTMFEIHKYPNSILKCSWLTGKQRFYIPVPGCSQGFYSGVEHLCLYSLSKILIAIFLGYWNENSGYLQACAQKALYTR